MDMGKEQGGDREFGNSSDSGGRGRGEANPGERQAGSNNHAGAGAASESDRARGGNVDRGRNPDAPRDHDD